jgi:hypothetical protein
LNSTTAEVLSLNALGFLGPADTALCGFAGASPSFTCIDHTICCDCLAAAKSTKTKSLGRRIFIRLRRQKIIR